jgi:transposase-like protein
MEDEMDRKNEWSVEQKTEIVLAHLGGEAGVSELARKQGLGASQLPSWKVEFLAAGQAALSGLEGKAERKQLEAKVERLGQMLGGKVGELEIAKISP